MTPHAYLFTDGSASKNDDVGAWGAVAVTPFLTARKVLYGVVHPTTISRCELLPMVEGLRWINANWHTASHSGTYTVCVISDSEYTVRTACGDYPRKKNPDLWAALDAAALGMQVKYTWRERNTHVYTEVCDALCSNLRKAVIKVLSQQFSDVRALESMLPDAEFTSLGLS